MLEAKTNCFSCEKGFPSFYSLPKQKKSGNGELLQNQDLTIDLGQFIGDSHDQELPEELTACQHFLVDSEVIRGRQHVFNLASTNFTPNFLKENLQHFFEILQCPANVNLVLSFVLRNVEDRNYRYFYALENILILERSQLISNKEDMLELQNILDKINIVKLNTRERSSAIWKFLIATNVTVFATLLKSVLVGCKNVLLTPRNVKRTDVTCLSYKANKERYNDNLCLLRPVCMHKTGTEKLEEETSKLPN